MVAADRLAASLSRVLARCFSGPVSVEGLARLSGGASHETWSFDARSGGSTVPLILRRAATSTRSRTALDKPTEAAVQEVAGGAGVPVAAVRTVLEPGDGLGAGYVMDRIEGETIARRILRDDAYADARKLMARQCGRILAAIHAAPRDRLPELPTASGPAQLATYRDLYDDCDDPHPVFELAFRHLEDRFDEPAELELVHGDFRNGNFVVGPDGIRAVLDWELAHLGDPMEDLAWVCVASWRFGEIDRPVGGFGDIDDLFAGYEEGGGRVDPERVALWELFGTLKWGIMCMMQGFAHLRAQTRSVEKAAIGRRASETEIDLLRLLA
jgi:aminoglycoside phosphotransferase (APT) family kinase protein